MLKISTIIIIDILTGWCISSGIAQTMLGPTLLNRIYGVGNIILGIAAAVLFIKNIHSK